MTREEAKQWIEILIRTMREETSGYYPDPLYKDEVFIALEMANKALEQQPCEDCISREAVNDGFKKYENGSFAYGCVWDYINKLPSVTPKEKTAAWVPIDAEPHDIYECNACGWLLYYEDTTDFKYCPNCGARMVSE